MGNIPGFDEPSIEPYKNPSSVVEGYKRVTLLITKDITQRVIRTFLTEHPFVEIYDIEPSPGHGHPPGRHRGQTESQDSRNRT